MVNKLTKQQVVGLLVGLRHKMIDDCAELDTTIEKKWLIPDCLEWAINFIEEQKESDDTIKLPCKIATPNDLPTFNWQVVWLTHKGGCIGTKSFRTESDADEFLAHLGKVTNE